jgi:hypothetical protein
MSKVFLIGNGESRKDFDLNLLKTHGKIYGCNGLYRVFTPDVLISVDHGIMHEIYHTGYCYNNKTWFRDWTTIPEFMYSSLIDAGLEKIDLQQTKQWDLIVANEKGDAQEFVMHGANLSGKAKILHRDKNTIEEKEVNQNQVFVSWIKPGDKCKNINELMPNNIDIGWAAGPTSGYIACKEESPSEVYLLGHDLFSLTNFTNNLFKGTKHYTIPEHSHLQTEFIKNWIEQWRILFTDNKHIKFYKVNTEINGKDKVNQPIEEWKDCNNIDYIDYKTLDNILKQ